MLEELVQKKCREIDGKAEGEKASVYFLKELIENEPEKYQRIFQEEVPEKIFTSLHYFVQQASDMWSKPIGVHITFAKSMPSPNVFCALDWGEWVRKSDNPDFQGEYLYELVPTELGSKVIDKYRACLGQPSLDAAKGEFTNIVNRAFGYIATHDPSAVVAPLGRVLL